MLTAMSKYLPVTKCYCLLLFSIKNYSLPLTIQIQSFLMNQMVFVLSGTPCLRKIHQSISSIARYGSICLLGRHMFILSVHSSKCSDLKFDTGFLNLFFCLGTFFLMFACWRCLQEQLFLNSRVLEYTGRDG